MSMFQNYAEVKKQLGKNPRLKKRIKNTLNKAINQNSLDKKLFTLLKQSIDSNINKVFSKGVEFNFLHDKFLKIFVEF